MKVVFAGTPEFAAQALDAIVAAGHDVGLVLTQPDRPAGRGMKLTFSDVKKSAIAHSLPVLQPVSLKSPGEHAAAADEAYDAIKAFGPDVLVVAAYGLILPERFLTVARFGALNIHASLLPRWRGAAPIQRAIEAGDKETGVSIMQMDEGLDTGDVITMEAVAITPDMSAGVLHDELAALGARMICEALDLIRDGRAVRTPQDNGKAVYAKKILKSEAKTDFNRPCEEVAARIMAFNPFPGATADTDGQTLKLWQAQAVPDAGNGEPGRILKADADGVLVSCASGAVRLTELQKSGAKRLPASEFLKGFSFTGGFFS